MSSRRSFNIDEMVRVVFAEKGSPSSKEEGHRKVPSVVGLASFLAAFLRWWASPIQTPLSGLWLMTMA